MMLREYGPAASRIPEPPLNGPDSMTGSISSMLFAEQLVSVAFSEMLRPPDIVLQFRYMAGRAS